MSRNPRSFRGAEFGGHFDLRLRGNDNYRKMSKPPLVPSAAELGGNFDLRLRGNDIYEAWNGCVSI